MDKKMIEVIDVNGKWNNERNEIEAKKAIEIANKNFSKYDSIMILTFNGDQQTLVKELIRKENKQLEQAIKDNKMWVSDIATDKDFQADLFIISVVYDPTTPISSTNVARQKVREAFNANLSKAKQKIIVLKSLTAKNAKQSDTKDTVMFKNWLAFLDDIDNRENSKVAMKIKEKVSEIKSAIKPKTNEVKPKPVKNPKEHKLENKIKNVGAKTEQVVKKSFKATSDETKKLFSFKNKQPKPVNQNNSPSIVVNPNGFVNDVLSFTQSIFSNAIYTKDSTINNNHVNFVISNDKQPLIGINVIETFEANHFQVWFMKVKNFFKMFKAKHVKTIFSHDWNKHNEKQRKHIVKWVAKAILKSF